MLQLTSSQRTFQRPPSTDISRVQNQENHLPEKKRLIESRFLIQQTTDSKSRNVLSPKEGVAKKSGQKIQVQPHNDSKHS